MRLKMVEHVEKMNAERDDLKKELEAAKMHSQELEENTGLLKRKLTSADEYIAEQEDDNEVEMSSDNVFLFQFSLLTVQISNCN